MRENSHQKPIILYEGKNTLVDLEKIKKNKPIWKVSDIFKSQLKELFEVTHPQLKQSPNFKKKLSEFIKKRKGGNEKTLYGNWIYFPWSGNLIHVVAEEEYNTLRTNRNKNLITEKEQKELLEFTIGIVGLSVGNGIALGLAYSGIGNTMKLAEPDRLETSNLNRVRAGLHQVGISKIEVTASQVYEINPYAKLIAFPKGLNGSTLNKFVTGKPEPKIIFEAIDDFEMKVRLRLEARQARVPVVMVTSLGDSLLVDIERYDINKNLPLFNGLIGKIPEEILKKPITEKDKHKYAVKIVGPQNVPKRALQSLKEIDKTLVGRPQLMSTVTVAGGVAAYLARRIALGESVPSGRKLMKFQKTFL